jgi:hypothetical protein
MCRRVYLRSSFRHGKFQKPLIPAVYASRGAPVTDLRTYMSSAFIEEMQAVEELDVALAELSETFVNTYDSKCCAWPYELRSDSLPKSDNHSQTTPAMILCAILALRNEWSNHPPRASSGYQYWPDFPLPSGMCDGLISKDRTTQSAIVHTIEKLLNRWSDNSLRRGTSAGITESETFGADDPMSLGWAVDLSSFFDRQHPGKEKYDKLFRRIVSRTVRCAKNLGEASTQPLQGTFHGNRAICRKLMKPCGGHEVGESSYLLIRYTMLLRSIKAQLRRIPKREREATHAAINNACHTLFERFEAGLHEQLSFAEMVDSRFDAAELSFGLEGMLLIRPEVVTRNLFDRVMSVLREVQESAGYWRSETPMVYQKKGEVLFTVSVESANAVLASFALYDKRWSVHDSVGTDHIDLLKRYWKWLKTRRSVVQNGARVSCKHGLKGWHSEHVNDPHLIHLWETSQVAEFLVNFRDQLKRHIARTTLKLAACSHKLPAIPKGIKLPAEEPPAADARWALASATFEPVTFLDEKFKVYERIGTSFVAPRKQAGQRSSAQPAYSMLLYGPPGTGKTTVATSLSWALDYPLISITVSDFLANGAVEIEARAKDLFQMLQAQPRSIVLFDEIDQFMLDRDSEYFRDQETVFQFLTPGMLTKLAELRASETVIFIIATNYTERIDRAIKRQGRIDYSFLLLPPDLKRRQGFIQDLWSNDSINPVEASKASVFATYGDLKSVKTASKASTTLPALKSMTPPATPEMYAARFKQRGGTVISDISRTPIEELFAMLFLEAEAAGLRYKTEAIEKYVFDRCSDLLPEDILDRAKVELKNFLGAN